MEGQAKSLVISLGWGEQILLVVIVVILLTTSSTLMIHTAGPSRHQQPHFTTAVHSTIVGVAVLLFHGWLHVHMSRRSNKAMSAHQKGLAAPTLHAVADAMQTQQHARMHPIPQVPRFSAPLPLNVVGSWRTSSTRARRRMPLRSVVYCCGTL